MATGLKGGIPAQRFKILSEETNIGSFNFHEDTGSDILNKAWEDTQKMMTEDASSLFNQVKEMGLNALEEASEMFSDLFRDSATLPFGLTDFKNAAASDISKWLVSSTGMGSSASEQISKLLSKCAGRGGNIGYNGKPFGVDFKCQGNTRSTGNRGGSNCSASNYNDLMKNLTKGGYNNGLKNTQSLLNAMLGLSGHGYGLGMCGIFGALKEAEPFSDLGNMVLGKASTTLLGAMSASQNVSGWIDVAASSIGLGSGISYPDAVPDFFANYEIPDGYKEWQYGVLGEASIGSAGVIDAAWGIAEDIGALSAAAFENITSAGKDVLEAMVSDKVYDYDGMDYSALNYIPDSDEDFTFAAGIAI